MQINFQLLKITLSCATVVRRYGKVTIEISVVPTWCAGYIWGFFFRFVLLNKIRNWGGDEIRRTGVGHKEQKRRTLPGRCVLLREGPRQILDLPENNFPFCTRGLALVKRFKIVRTRVGAYRVDLGIRKILDIILSTIHSILMYTLRMISY